MYRRVVLLGGMLALGGSLLATVAPGVVAFRPDRLIVSLIGIVALVQTLRVIRSRRHGERTEAETPDPELPRATPSPGENLEAALEPFVETHGFQSRHTRIRDGLESVAVAVLTQYEGYTEADARAAVAAGTWTDDDHAAAFLSDEDTPTPSLGIRLGDIVRRRSSFDRGVRHTVDAIATAAGVSARPADGDRSRHAGTTQHGVDAVATPDATATAGAGTASDDTPAETDANDTYATGHWRGVSVVALLGIGVGVLVEQPAVLLAGAIGIGFVAYARSTALPPGEVSVDRTLSATQPTPGETVEVTVTVTNESDRVLADCRVVDGVPDALAVTEGSPRLGTALRAGERTTFTYTVTARRGVHTFGPATAIRRDLTGAVERERPLATETTLTCRPRLRPLADPVPLRDQTAQYVGRVDTSSGGPGTEFYATREYRPGDPMSRIDWNHQARTGELTTVEFREERATTVVLVIDARVPAYLAPTPHTPHAVDRAVDAAGQLFATLTAAGDRVGITALSPEPCWLAPATGGDHRVAGRELLATHPALSPAPPNSRVTMRRWLNQLRTRLDPGTQLLVLTPLCDEYSGRVARRLNEYGYPVTVISPDPTADRVSSHRLARVIRTLEISTLRRRGVPVIDWPWEDPVEGAIARYSERRPR